MKNIQKILIILGIISLFEGNLFGCVNIKFGINNSGILNTNKKDHYSTNFAIEFIQTKKIFFNDYTSIGFNFVEIGGKKTKVEFNSEYYTDIFDVEVGLLFLEVPLRLGKELYRNNEFYIAGAIGLSLFVPLKDNSKLKYIESIAKNENKDSEYYYMQDPYRLIKNTEVGFNYSLSMSYKLVSIEYKYSIFISNLDFINVYTFPEKLHISNLSFILRIR